MFCPHPYPLPPPGRHPAQWFGPPLRPCGSGHLAQGSATPSAPAPLGAQIPRARLPAGSSRRLLGLERARETADCAAQRHAAVLQAPAQNVVWRLFLRALIDAHVQCGRGHTQNNQRTRQGVEVRFQGIDGAKRSRAWQKCHTRMNNTWSGALRRCVFEPPPPQSPA